MGQVIRVGAVLALLGCSSALAARRAEVAVVGVHVAGMDDKAAIEASAQLTEALDATEKIDTVTPGEVRGRLAGREALVVEGTFLGPGRADLNEGKVLYERAEFEGAIPVLGEAVEKLQDGLAGATDSKDLIEALILLGMAHASTGDAEQARKTFKAVVTLDPARELDQVNYPPRMVSLFNEVRGQVRAAPAARLVVQAPEDGARVYVDGIDRGQAPVTVEGLPPGTHYVLVIGAGGKRSFDEVELQPDGRRVYQAPLDTRALATAGGDAAERARQTRLLYSSLGTHIATGLVLIGGELPDGNVGMQLYETRTGNFSQILSAPSNGAPVSAMLDLVPSVAAWLTEDGTLRPDRVAKQVAPMALDDNALLASVLLDPEPIIATVEVKKGWPWWAWAGVVTVAAGGAAGTAIALTADEPVDPNQGTIVVSIP